MSADSYDFTVEGRDYADVKERATVIARAYWGDTPYQMRTCTNGDIFRLLGTDARKLVQADVTTVSADQ